LRMSAAAPVDHATQQSNRILDSVRVGIICVDLEGRITFANPAAAHMMDYSVEELRGQPIWTHMQFSGSNGASDTGLRPATPGEDVCWREDGTSFPIEYESALIGEDEHIEGTVVTFRDITQRRAAEQLKNELIALVSHELRTPLTSIRSALGLLVGGIVGDLPSKGRRMLEIAVANTDRLIRLVNDILDLEHADSGQMSMHSVECDAAELIALAAESVRPTAEQAGIVLDLRSHRATLSGDADRLVQVLTNLLSNAIKFSPPGGGTVWVEAECSADEVVFRVRDEGRGIPADKLEAIFDRFVQVNDSDWREKGGAGLGLAICRSIVKQHQGHIWAESTLGAGTTLCVALPKKASQSPQRA
jgi:PAS domain S-box-containing protein